MDDNHTNEFTNPPGTLSWLVEIMQRLLGPAGCPWDREQTIESLKPFLLEECYEVLDAIDENDKTHHCEELGDLLFQIIFQAELAKI
ncbi:MAG: MazG nucleotide pyrophosphohydrolase domain-containing protein, partial [Pseudomonadota bacterium]